MENRDDLHLGLPLVNRHGSALAFPTVHQMNDSPAQAYWQAEYEFYHRIIAEEVDRLRFNQGYESFEVDLYATHAKNRPAFLGITRIGRKTFRCIAHWAFDGAGKQVLKVKVSPQP